MSAATASNTAKRRHGKSAAPALSVTAVRPPGMKRATAISSPAHRELALGPADGLPRLIAVKEALLRAGAEAAADQIRGVVAEKRATGSGGDDQRQIEPQAAATTPAVITDASLGTTGTNTSRTAKTKTMPYAHPDASETSRVN